MIGLSSSYYGLQKKKVYESAKSVFDLGFETVELGAAHGPEENIWDTVKKIKHDFPDKNYTVHGLFPPPEQRMWFNASLGLTKQNNAAVEAFFKTAEITEAKMVSIHPGFREEIIWKEHDEPESRPATQRKIPEEKAWEGVFKVIEKSLNLAEDVGCNFAIENVPNIAIPLVYSPNDFEKTFEKFPDLKLLLDYGHALYDNVLPIFLDKFHNKIGQVHLHFSRAEAIAPTADEHDPITSFDQVNPLLKVKQFKEIPIIFEHWPKTKESQIAEEKKLIEKFESKF